MSEIGEIPQEKYQKEKALITFGQILSAIKRDAGKYPPPFETTLLTQLANQMFDNLPPGVVAVQVKEGLIAQRTQREINQIPEAFRQTWTLPQIDSHAANIAQSLNKEWTPIYPNS